MPVEIESNEAQPEQQQPPQDEVNELQNLHIDGENVDAKEHFIAPLVQNNPDGWGPCELPDQFKDIPYQPFSKGDRIGKVSY